VSVRLLPIQSVLAVALACCLVPRSVFAQTKSDGVEGSNPTSPTTSGLELPWYLPPANQAFVAPRPPPPFRAEPTAEEKLNGASVELNFEPAFFLGGNAPPRPGFFALFRLAGPVAGFDMGVLTNVGLPGDTVEPLGRNPAGLPATRSQTSAFVIGANFLHYSLELTHQPSNHLYLVLPELDFRFIFSFANVPSSSGTSGGLVVAPGVSLLGLRFARCIGDGWSWVTEVRGPTAFAYLPLMYGGDTANPYMSVGFSVATGFAL
jgi:hypothetical protein